MRGAPGRRRSRAAIRSRPASVDCAERPGRAGARLGGERLGLELLEQACALLDRRLCLAASGGAEVVARRDPAEPGAQAREVGLRLLDLRVRRATAGTLGGDLLEECRHAFADLAVLVGTLRT